EFRAAISRGDLIEYEEIFGNYYGTMRSQVRAGIERGDFVIFDVDVKGALSLRSAFPDDTLLIFVAPPSMDVLERRLRDRHTETDAQIAQRLARAEMEMAHREAFDVVLVNDDLQRTLDAAERIVREAMMGSPTQPGLFEA
ncbi:MAG TPA: guanylate kinase, partial [Bacteroidetes bacterium]|nr:guanylate kinase [Bacteroidota bacterium]